MKSMMKYAVGVGQMEVVSSSEFVVPSCLTEDKKESNYE